VVLVIHTSSIIGVIFATIVDLIALVRGHPSPQQTS
jgi:hypothetical protein